VLHSFHKHAVFKKTGNAPTLFRLQIFPFKFCREMSMSDFAQCGKIAAKLTASDSTRFRRTVRLSTVQDVSSCTVRQWCTSCSHIHSGLLQVTFHKICWPDRHNVPTEVCHLVVVVGLSLCTDDPDDYLI